MASRVMVRVMVIGLGRMGAPLAATLLERGYPVSVWNRTPSKAAPLVAAGAIKAESVAAGIRANDVVVICVGTYEDADALLVDCGDLKGKTLIHLTTSTASESRAMETWALERGALYLDGAIFAFPREVGLAECRLVVAGSRAAWRESEDIVMCLGGSSRYMGENVGAPAALDSALIIPSLSATMGLIQGAQLIQQEGMDLGEYVEDLIGLLTADACDELRRQGSALARNDFAGAEAALETWAVAVSKLVQEDAKQGINVEFSQVISGLLERAVEAGYGEEEVVAVSKVMKLGVA